jgi:hypothetical protein
MGLRDKKRQTTQKTAQTGLSSFVPFNKHNSIKKRVSDYTVGNVKEINCISDGHVSFLTSIKYTGRKTALPYRNVSAKCSKYLKMKSYTHAHTRARHRIQKIPTCEIREHCNAVTLICPISYSRISLMGSWRNQDRRPHITACGLAMHPINHRGLNTMNCINQTAVRTNIANGTVEEMKKARLWRQL